MRLAFVNSTHRWGGVKTWCMDMGCCALEAGHEVFTYGRDIRFVKAAHDAGMYARQVNFGPDFNPLCILFFLREFRRLHVSHVIVNVGKDLRSAGIAAHLLGLPVIVHVGDPYDFSDSFRHHCIHNWLRPAYVCCSNFTRIKIMESVPWLKGSLVEAIYPGTVMPDDAPLPCHTPRVLITTSQLTPSKRHEDLIRGCAILRDQGVDFRLNIVGTGCCEQALRELTSSLQLDERIIFRGYVQGVASELRKADIFVLPTAAEPLGIALEEAMAYGLYPVARNSGGAPEIWHPEYRDTLMPPAATPEDFSRTLCAVLELDENELMGRRLKIQQHARQTFSRQHQFDLFAEFLESLEK